MDTSDIGKMVYETVHKFLSAGWQNFHKYVLFYCCCFTVLYFQEHVLLKGNQSLWAYWQVGSDLHPMYDSILSHWVWIIACAAVLIVATLSHSYLVDYKTFFVAKYVNFSAVMYNSTIRLTFFFLYCNYFFYCWKLS